jgi:glutamate racemase
LLGPQVQLVSTGDAGARQTRRLLEVAALLHQGGVSTTPNSRLLTTGDLRSLQAAAQRWLGLPPQICQGVSAALPD